MIISNLSDFANLNPTRPRPFMGYVGKKLNHQNFQGWVCLD